MWRSRTWPRPFNSIRCCLRVEPTVVKADYAKWMLEDPRVNFAISMRGRKAGLDHLGIQVETAQELEEVYGRLSRADRPVLEVGDSVCCYAKSEKSWIDDPAGISWEAFRTTGESTFYGHSTERADGVRVASASCCTPKSDAAEPASRCC